MFWFVFIFWGISAWYLYLGIVAENTWWAFMREVISIYEGKEKLLGYSIMWATLLFSSVQFNHSVMSDSLQPHESQHARPPCPSPTPGVHSDSCPLSRWCHPAISSSFIPFSSCSKSLPASDSCPMSQLFSWGGQNTGVSALHHSFQRTPRADLL